MALRHRLGGMITALRREHPRLQRTEELRHFARLLIIRNDLMTALADGLLEPQRMRLLSETNRQIESCGSRLRIFSPMPKAGTEPDEPDEEPDDEPEALTNLEMRRRLAQDEPEEAARQGRQKQKDK